MGEVYCAAATTVSPAILRSSSSAKRRAGDAKLTLTSGLVQKISLGNIPCPRRPVYLIGQAFLQSRYGLRIAW